MGKNLYETNAYYHVYNRSAEKRDIFRDDRDYIRFLRGLREFNRIEPVKSLYLKAYLEKQAGGEKGLTNPIGFVKPVQPPAALNEKGLSNPIGFDKPRPCGEMTNKGFSNPIGFEKPRTCDEKLGDSSRTDNRLVDILCYCLNPNHFHLLLRQAADNGISKFMKRLGIGYANYFNLKYRRSGTLFQGTFKAVEIRYYSRLIYLSAYINGNPQIHGLSSAVDWPWSSGRDYLCLRQGTICDKSEILDEFRDAAEYRRLMDSVIKDAKQGKTELKEILED